MKIEELEAWAEAANDDQTVDISVPLRHFEELVAVAKEATKEYRVFGARPNLKKALDELEAVE